MTTLNTLSACLSWGEKHPNPNVRQDARRLSSLCEWRKLNEFDLETTPASVPNYLERIAPRFAKRNVRLVRDIVGAYTVDTYKQYQRSGRRLIDLFTGEVDAAAERRARQDEWSLLIVHLQRLASSGLVSAPRLRPLARLADTCRRVGLRPRDLGAHQLHTLRAAVRYAKEWQSIIRALRFLDSVRVHVGLLVHLPEAPVGAVDEPRRRVFVIPPAVSEKLEAWISQAARTQVEDERFEHLAEQLSEETRSRLCSALRNYAYTAGETGTVSLTLVSDLSELFDRRVIDATIGRWVDISSAPGGLMLRSIADYCSDLIVILSRNGLAEPASYIGGLCKVHRDLKSGCSQRRTMSAKNRTWCRNLLASEEKISLFETQHIHYWRIANEALEEAKKAGLDLKRLTSRFDLDRLDTERCKLAERLIGEARRFGVCAAFAAIELEGAPFRKSNTLDLSWQGKPTTFFDHSMDTDPHFTIIIPNEFLKNGDAMTQRGEELPPIEIRDLSPGDHGCRILRWFIDEIRPLFPDWKHTNHLFPRCRGKQSRLNTRTLDVWLYDCSTAIGLPLTPHNFRHGYVSIHYNSDRSCLGDLAIIMGALESTLSRHYAFIDRARTAREIQDSIRRRRETRREAWCPVPIRRAA